MGLSFDPITAAGENWREHAWGDGVAMVAATSISRAHQILLARINASLGPFGLTFSRFEVLALLYFSRRRELPMGKIGSRLQVHPTSVTSLVNRLEKDGLVARVQHPTDRRTTLVRLTERGAQVTPLCAAQLEAIEFGLNELSGDDHTSLARLISPIRKGNEDWVLDQPKP